MSPDEIAQREHFELQEHQYPIDSILHPQLHTEIELKRVVAAIGEPRKGDRVLDFGAGTGRLTVALVEGGHDVHAVDLSERSLDRLGQALDELGLPPVASSTALPVTGCFRAIVGADVLHHVDLDTYLPRLQALLGRQGKVVFTEPGGRNPIWYAYLTLFYDMRVERRIMFSTPRSLRRAFTRHGYRNVRITGIGLLPRPLFGWSERLCSWHDRLGNAPILRSFAYRYLIEADSGPS
jgi:ubiquinone/menaquinone biosynthesis C-methylase UbiE